MNYPYLIPGAQVNPASFVANATLTLGFYDKPIDTAVWVTVDYTQVLLPSDLIINYSFKVKPGGFPQLAISSTSITANVLGFTLSGGIGGCTYKITINTEETDGAIRSDTLAVNVLGDDCGCYAFPIPISNGVATSGDGDMFINVAPRFFVSNTPPIGANVLDRWYETSNSSIYDFVTDGRVSWWQKAILGGGGGYGATVVKMQPITPDGITTGFILSAQDDTVVNIPTANSLLVSVDGVWQEPITQFEASGNYIAFSEAPLADSIVFMLWLSPVS